MTSISEIYIYIYLYHVKPFVKLEFCNYQLSDESLGHHFVVEQGGHPL